MTFTQPSVAGVAVGVGVGLGVGEGVGLGVGEGVGLGAIVGAVVGVALGASVGVAVAIGAVGGGVGVGVAVGITAGEAVGVGQAFFAELPRQALGSPPPGFVGFVALEASTGVTSATPRASTPRARPSRRGSMHPMVRAGPAESYGPFFPGGHTGWSVAPKHRAAAAPCRDAAADRG